MSFLKTFKHLLPRALAWNITPAKTLRKFFEGLSALPDDIKMYFDQVYEDLDPQKTRELDAFESLFALPDTLTVEQDRRDRLEETWRQLGGQDPAYIQERLQAAGFDVYVHEWWEPVPSRPAGGSVDGDHVPVARNPFLYLDDGTAGDPYLMVDGEQTAQEGEPNAQDGSTATPLGYPLVNKILIGTDTTICDGAPLMQDGDPQAQDGGVLVQYTRKQYTIPADPTKHPYFLYIGGQTFPDNAEIESSRRDEFEDLCLKLCPLEQWLGILVTYT